NYYKWTQWIFIKLFNHYYDKKYNKALPIKHLIKKKKLYLLNKYDLNNILNKYRLAYKKKKKVNWCPQLQTVLANEEIKHNKSIIGEYNIKKIKMSQWHLRITKYIPRLLKDYNKLLWEKEIINLQKKWINKKKKYFFFIKINNLKFKIKKKKINNIYINYFKKKIKFLYKIFKKKYIKKVINKLKNKKINIIQIKLIYKKKIKINIFIYYKKKKKKVKKIKIKFFFNKLLIKKKNIYNLKDIVFSRQRYWGEPIPIYYKNNIPYNIPLKNLPLKLPLKKNKKFNKLIKYKKWAWNSLENKVVYNKLIKKNNKIFPLEFDTMPSFAGSNWYYLRYIDNKNNKELINKTKEKYWNNVDIYIGGIEHVNGHLLYSRFIYKFLYDINIVKNKLQEPFKKFIKQGLIFNYSYCIYKNINKREFISYDIISSINKKKKKKFQKIYINKIFIKKIKELNIKKIKKIFKNYVFLKKKNKKFYCNKKLEKMSKSKLNIIEPNKIIKQHGLDCFRLYIIFIGPFTKKKIWNLNKIIGIKRYLNKLWNFYNKKNKNKTLQNKVIDSYYIYKKNFILNFKKYKFNKNISILMEILNLFIKKNFFITKILKDYIKLLSLFAPNISEEIWEKIYKKKKSIFFENFTNINLNKKKKKYIIFLNNKKKDILFIKNKNNKFKNILKIIKKKKYFLYIKKKIKKYIFKKNKILNIIF
ncbi:MAG: class I tRNA ligase family protein, partial [Candidatus Shikimatogenerans sp. JK-2022]|nr:class I tRNA ligase family protein [Candidatus Shikimatogenerans bostrichidophilus]